MKIEFKKGKVFKMPDEAIIYFKDMDAKHLKDICKLIQKTYPKKSILLTNQEIRVVDLKKLKKAILKCEKVIK